VASQGITLVEVQSEATGICVRCRYQVAQILCMCKCGLKARVNSMNNIVLMFHKPTRFDLLLRPPGSVLSYSIVFHDNRALPYLSTSFIGFVVFALR